MFGGIFISSFISLEETFSEVGELIGKDSLPHFSGKTLQITEIMEGEESQAENFISADEVPDIRTSETISASVAIAI